jgi:hypothetical protein
MHNWLVGTNKVFVNNFGGVFAEQFETRPGKPFHLDHCVAGLFESMQEGSIMVTLHPLELGPTLEEANRQRVAKTLSTSLNASFF